MRPILAGIETEYGLQIAGRRPDEQLDDSFEVVESLPTSGLRAWDDRFESPRQDLRGFRLDRLATDPEDARYDATRTAPAKRGDWVLANGARFYNDHGHPEYATPESWSCRGLALQDKVGENVVWRAAQAYQERTGRQTRLFKNNTDFHGASYGTHESYLVPREVGFERLFAAIAPMLVARTLLCGAGKVGNESGETCDYQLSQRADFLVEDANAETLYRRPLFNTRDEPHADPAKWIRLHVIAGDANRMFGATLRKIGLVKVALALAESGRDPVVRLKDPVAALRAVSRHPESQVATDDGPMTAAEILLRYFDAAEAISLLDAELREIIVSCRELLAWFENSPERFARNVDWAAKKVLLERFVEAEGKTWKADWLAAYDLEYHLVEPGESLFDALVAAGELEGEPTEERPPVERNRAWARGLAVSQFGEHLECAGWRRITLGMDGSLVDVDLPPDAVYPAELESAANVGQFVEILRGVV